LLRLLAGTLVVLKGCAEAFEDTPPAPSAPAPAEEPDREDPVPFEPATQMLRLYTFPEAARELQETPLDM